MLKIGWSKRDVTTKDPVCIPGQMHCRISEGVLDPIYLTCLVMDDGNDCVIFLSGDFVSADGVIDTVREKVLAQRTDIPTEKILFNITHTHCGPLIQKEESYLRDPFDKMHYSAPEIYRNFMTDMAAEAITEAWDSREEGAFSYGYGYAVAGHSRRVAYLDDYSTRPDVMPDRPFPFMHAHGHVRMYGNTRDDLFAGYEGGADHYINLLYTFDKSDKLTGAIINVPCPSQNSEQEYHLTADYWHNVRTILQEKYGDIFILAQCAAAGDISPRTLHYNDAENRRYRLKYGEIENADILQTSREMFNRMDIANRICDAFDEVLSWAQKEKITDAPIGHTVKTLQLENRMITDEEYEFLCNELAFQSQFDFQNTGDEKEDFKQNTTRAHILDRYRIAKERYEKNIATSPMELHTVRIGDVAFASNAFELYQDFMHRIQARSPFMQTFVVQLCSQPEGYPGGYLATKRAAENRGYSATMYCNQISPEGGKTLVEETVAALKQLVDV